MRKIFIVIILFSLMISCQQNNTYIKKEWVSTDTGFLSREGVLIDLTDDDTLLLSSFFNPKDKTSYKYQIDSINTLILNDTIEFGKILKQTETVFIVKDSIKTYTFMPIRNYQLQTDIKTINEILVSNDWQLNDLFGSFRLEFTNQSAGFKDKRIKECFRINEKKGYEYKKFEYWSLVKYRKSIFIILTRNNMTPQYYQLKSISDSMILAETCWSDSIEETKFTIEKKLPTTEHEKLKQTIIGKWELTEYKEPVDSSMILGLEEEIIPITRKRDRTSRNRPFSEEDSVPMILDTYYKNKNIYYEFSSDSTCSMNTKDLLLRESTWKLSEDGKYINMFGGFMGSMKIISFSESKLVTEKHETIEYEEIGLEIQNDCDNKYIRETFKKVK